MESELLRLRQDRMRIGELVDGDLGRDVLRAGVRHVMITAPVSGVRAEPFTPRTPREPSRRRRAESMVTKLPDRRTRRLSRADPQQRRGIPGVSSADNRLGARWSLIPRRDSSTSIAGLVSLGFDVTLTRRRASTESDRAPRPTDASMCYKPKAPVKSSRSANRRTRPGRMPSTTVPIEQIPSANQIGWGVSMGVTSPSGAGFIHISRSTFM